VLSPNIKLCNIKKVYESMETDNVFPDHLTCSQKMHAWQYFEKMNGKGVKWGEEVLGALIKSVCVEVSPSEALIIESKMERKWIFKFNCVKHSDGQHIM
jgi:hypothetical protein